MKQIEILKTNKIPTDEEFIRWANDAAALIYKYDWENRSVWPWNYPIPLTKIVNDIYDAPLYTYGSKVELYLLAKGLTNILNAWERTELEGVKIRSLKTGKVSKVDKDIAEELIAEGYAERVE